MPGTEIVLAGQKFDVGKPVVLWTDPGGLNSQQPTPQGFYPFSRRPGCDGDPNLDTLRGLISQFVVHADGCRTSASCWDVLQNERGLSVCFLIDNDGTIYQTLEGWYAAWHAGADDHGHGMNGFSLGVEMCNRSTVMQCDLNYYPPDRAKKYCTINGGRELWWDYTDPEYDSLIALCKTLAAVFPKLKTQIPGSGDSPVYNTLPDPPSFAGFYGHYHITTNKVDPGPLDWKRFLDGIQGGGAGKVTFPLSLGGFDVPTVPAKQDDRDPVVSSLYDNNEQAMGGYFPLGMSRIWHGGVHLHGNAGDPVYAPFGGTIVAARMASDTLLGSRNFVLIKHDIKVQQQDIEFFSLFMHLMKEDTPPDPGDTSAPQWLDRQPPPDPNAPPGATQPVARDALDQAGDDPVSLNVPISGGEVLGRVGMAGVPGQFDSQIHFEIFAASDIGATLDPGYWTAIDGEGTGFCDRGEIWKKVQGPSDPFNGDGGDDGVVTSSELVKFFQTNDNRIPFRKLVTHHASEWSDGVNWKKELGSDKYGHMDSDEVDQLVNRQIKPFLWWTSDYSDMAQQAGLPGDQTVYTYHPITFMDWLAAKLLQPPEDIDQSQIKDGVPMPLCGGHDDPSQHSNLLAGNQDAIDQHTQALNPPADLGGF
jgi:N-acetyl-anhydromuramyl-L-alanine amidase AmpD